MGVKCGVFVLSLLFHDNNNCIPIAQLVKQEFDVHPFWLSYQHNQLFIDLFLHNE